MNLRKTIHLTGDQEIPGIPFLEYEPESLRDHLENGKLIEKEWKREKTTILNRRGYASDLRDAEWEQLKPLIPEPGPGGRPPKWERREIVNAILYILKTGCQWHLLPHDFPPYQTVFTYFRQWRREGRWEQINRVLREQMRLKLGREAEPSAAIIDSQSVKTAEKGG